MPLLLSISICQSCGVPDADKKRGCKSLCRDSQEVPAIHFLFLFSRFDFLCHSGDSLPNNQSVKVIGDDFVYRYLLMLERRMERFHRSQTESQYSVQYEFLPIHFEAK